MYQPLSPNCPRPGLAVVSLIKIVSSQIPFSSSLTLKFSIPLRISSTLLLLLLLPPLVSGKFSFHFISSCPNTLPFLLTPLSYLATVPLDLACWNIHQFRFLSCLSFYCSSTFSSDCVITFLFVFSFVMPCSSVPFILSKTSIYTYSFKYLYVCIFFGLALN